MPGRQEPPDQRPRHFDIEEVELDPGVDARIQREALRAESRYAALGLVAGSGIMLAGVVLTMLGFSGAVEIGVEAGDASGSVTTGSLGIVVLLVGAAIIWFTRFRFRIKGDGKGSA